jgi:SAM-dependent methyltransferase
LPSLQGKRGLEIGGPSAVFRDWFRPFPIYKHIGVLDNCDLSKHTVWADHSDEFKFWPGKTGRNIFGEGSFLPNVSDDSYDFILSSHNLEHFANPIRALKEWIRVTKPGGNIVIVLPHYAKMFDRKRKPTTLQHMIDDYEKDIGEDDLPHVEETFTANRFNDPTMTDEEFMDLLTSNFHHRMMHHHCFDESNSRELLEYVGLNVISVEFKLPFHIFLISRKAS